MAMALGAKAHVAAGRRVAGRKAPRSAGRATAVAARAEARDFDSLLELGAEKWEKAENKPVLVGYGVGGLVALSITETVVHAPVLNVLLGFPLELLGILSAGSLALRYLKEGEDPLEDLGKLGDTLSDTLPGLK